jgi:hypothetical protein
MPSDSASELCEYVRSRLPVRSRLLGREKVDALVLATIAEWPTDWLLRCERESQDYGKPLEDTAQRVSFALSGFAKDERYGFIWAFLLSAVLSAVVKEVLEWWLSRWANRAKMAVWQCEMRGSQ